MSAGPMTLDDLVNVSADVLGLLAICFLLLQLKRNRTGELPMRGAVILTAVQASVIGGAVYFAPENKDVPRMVAAFMRVLKDPRVSIGPRPHASAERTATGRGPLTTSAAPPRPRVSAAVRRPRSP